MNGIAPDEETPSPELSQRIDQSCDRFEAEWRAGRRPRLEDHLGEVPGPGRRELLRQLLAVELAYRIRSGESPTPDEYRSRFPGDEDLIRTIFVSVPTHQREAVLPEPASRGGADRNLLFGILAQQLDLISREALVAAINAWALDKDKPLGRILVEQGNLDEGRRMLLEALVCEHLARHGGVPEASLAALSSIGAIRGDLEQIADPDVQACLPHVSAARTTGGGPEATWSRPGGTSTSAGARFRILRPHARGGLGEVFVARDEELSREVALKQIQPQFAHDPNSRSRFVVEAEITGRLEHPGIVPVYGLGTYADGRPFYAMRFIRGDNLGEAIVRFHAAEGPGRDPGERALELRRLLGRFVDVCNAVAYAHSRGVLHRDLKPGNILLGEYGETLVVDWGLAKPMSGRSGEASTPDDRTLRPTLGGGSAETLPGSALGTPQYMSPEQAEGQFDRVGPASDVYGLGATLYHLLTDRAPFDGPEAGAILSKVRRGEFRPPGQISRHVPGALEAICLKAMTMQPEDRYPSPIDLAADVEHWLADEPVTAHRESWPERTSRWARRHRSWVRAGALALLVVATVSVAAGLSVSRSLKRAADAEAQKRLQADESLRETRTLLARWARDRGLNLGQQRKHGDGLLWLARAYQVAPDEALDLRKTILSDLNLWRFAYRSFRHSLQSRSGSPIHAVALRPDGKVLLLGSDNKTPRLFDLTSRTPSGAPLVHEGPIRAIAFSPDGRTLLTGSEDAMARLWDVATGTLLGSPLVHKGAVHAVAFSPDGRTILTGGQDGTARLWEAGTGRPLGPVLTHGGPIHAVAFRPDGGAVLTGGEDREARLWDVSTGAALGAPWSMKAPSTPWRSGPMAGPS